MNKISRREKTQGDLFFLTEKNRTVQDCYKTTIDEHRETIDY